VSVTDRAKSWAKSLALWIPVFLGLAGVIYAAAEAKFVTQEKADATYARKETIESIRDDVKETREDVREIRDWLRPNQ
jgi:uncharacterized protein YcfJ